MNANDSRQFIATFTAGADGTGKANPMVKLFDAGMTGVLIAVAD